MELGDLVRNFELNQVGWLQEFEGECLSDSFRVRVSLFSGDSVWWNLADLE